MLKKLSVLSYICSLLMGMLFIYFVITAVTIAEEEKHKELNWINFMWILPCVMQFIYTYKTSSVLKLAVFKPTESLDDYAMNDMELTDEIVQNGFWLKGFALLNSIILCFYFLNVFSSLLNYVSSLFESWPWFEKIYLLISIAIALLALPTVLYNLRTFNISRIRRTT